MDTGDCQTNMLANRDAEIAALCARVAELEERVRCAETVRSVLVEVCRVAVPEQDDPIHKLKFVFTYEDFARMQSALSSCPPLESITKAASPSEIDRLEDENAALRKAVGELQKEVLGLVDQKWVRREDYDALRARVAELEEANTRLAELLVLCAAWAAKAEAVRVAAWGHITTWPDDDPDPVATARLRAALSSCPPLESVTACRHGESK